MKNKKTFKGLLEWFTSLFQLLLDKPNPKAWWVRIKTEEPEYTYYFGPFKSLVIAQEKLPGYAEDLRTEQAQVSSCTVDWCTPPKFTIKGTHLPAQ